MGSGFPYVVCMRFCDQLVRTMMDVGCSQRAGFQRDGHWVPQQQRPQPLDTNHDGHSIPQLVGADHGC